MTREIEPRSTYGNMTVPSNEGYVMNTLLYEQASNTPPSPRTPYKIAGRERLTEQLSSNDPREITIFNCINFAFGEARNRDGKAEYPEASPIMDNPLQIAEWYQNDLQRLVDVVRMSGPTNLTIIVPDSEFDKRVMNFPDDATSLKEKAQQLKQGLTEKLTTFRDDQRVRVETITEFCERNNLPSPYEVTTEMYERITSDPTLMRKIKDASKKDVKGYFLNKGLSEEYVNALSPEEIQERTTWYYAMYMAEGKLLADANTMMIDVESNGRVRAWMERGSEGMLPIITPVDTASYKPALQNRIDAREDRV